MNGNVLSIGEAELIHQRIRKPDKNIFDYLCLWHVVSFLYEKPVKRSSFIPVGLLSKPASAWSNCLSKKTESNNISVIF